MDATDSESNLAAREAVISFMSYLGQSSTISIPTIPELTACLTKQVSSTLVSPHGVGTDTREHMQDQDSRGQLTHIFWKYF